MTIYSWGNIHSNSEVIAYPNKPLKNKKSFLPIGHRRSYGDVGLNSNGIIIDMTSHDCILSFDQQEKSLKAQSGIAFESLLRFLIPKGFFLPVVPGTKFITLGGAVANDIHGKNHHIAGSFGNSILELSLIRKGNKIICSKDRNSDLFYATIGGMGLTGIIDWVKFHLKEIKSDQISVTNHKFFSFEELTKLEEKSSDTEFHVSWINSNKVKKLEGIFMAGEFLENNHFSKFPRGGNNINIPPLFSQIVTSNLSFKILNELIFHKQIRNEVKTIQDYDKYFFPLDGIGNWNQFYGKNGFYQFQCAIPSDSSEQAILELLSLLKNSGHTSFISVLKKFGNIKSKGLMSFPMSGYTFCLDVKNYGKRTHSLFAQMEQIVAEAEGRLYPAKDALMNKDFFKSSYPDTSAFAKLIDPSIESDFKKRMEL